MTPLADLLIRSSIVLAAGLLLAACLRKHSAALRHAVIATAVFTSAAVIPFSLFGPAWEITVPSAPTQTSTTRIGTPAATVPASGVTEPVAPAAAWWSPVALIWFGGFLAMAATLAVGVARLRRIAARAARIEDARWTA